MACSARTSIRSFAGPVMLLVAVVSSAGTLCAAGRVRLSFGIGAGDMGGYHTNAWAVGVELGLLFNPWKAVGFQISGLGVTGSGGVHDGLLADAGLWKSFGPERAPTLMLVGISLNVGSQTGGGDLAGLGAHVGLRQEAWLGRNVGLYGRAVLRYFWSQDLLSPSLSGGIAFRF